MPPVTQTTTRPTIFLVVHQGFAARYLLRTALFGALRAAGARLVILTPNADEAYMHAEFESDGVAIEPLHADVGQARRSRLWWLLYHLRTYTLAAAAGTQAFQTKYAGFRTRLAAERRLIGWAIHLALQPLWRSRLLRRALLGIETRLYSPLLHAELFERYRPDLVVTTSPGWFLPDAIVLREARRRAVPGAAVIAGWDNPSSKGYRGADPELIVAWSDRMAQQLVDYHDVRPERIAVEGVPHFDRYVRQGALWSREELYRRTGLDPDRRIVLYATSTPGAYGHNLAIIEGLAAAIDDGRLPNAQLVVRLHPIHMRPGQEAPIAELEAVRARHLHVHLDIPDVQSTRLRCDLHDSDNQRFSSLLAASDVLVCVFSTTTLEAFLADRPVVFASWTAHLPEGESGAKVRRPDGLAQRPWDEFVHLRELVDAGAVRVGRSLPELVGHTRRYLNDPGLDREQRRHFAHAECGMTDGYSGERVAARLLALAGAAPQPPNGPAPAQVPLAEGLPR